MIITVEDLKKQVNCGTAEDALIKNRLEAIEAVIRAYTNNNFQQRGIRFVGYSEGGILYGDPKFFAIGDTIQISASAVNNGLYVVDNIYFNQDGRISVTLDKPLFDTESNLVTKVQYPPDVVQCAVDLFKWHQNMGEKVGIKSETISRHSVTYEDSATLYMGYPVGILNGLKLYKKARC